MSDSHSSTTKVSDQDYDIIQLLYPDIHGIPRGKMIPGKLLNSFSKKGLEFLLYSMAFGTRSEIPMTLKEMYAGNLGNGILFPELDTLVEAPWISKPGRKIGQMFVQMLQEDGLAEKTSVRHQISRQLNKMSDEGLSLQSSFSYQFKCYKEDSNCTEVLGSKKSTNNLSAYGFIGVESTMVDLSCDLNVAGVPLESVSHGHGPGSFELSTVVEGSLKTADIGMRLKSGIKGIMAARGYSATFMSQPHAKGDNCPSDCKFRFTLSTKDGQNAFTEANEDGISGLCRSWIAGLIKHGPALTALFCPTVNCYNRLREDDKAPRQFDWAINSSTTSINVTVILGSEVWLEMRLPSSASNPYFVMLGTLAAGMDGMENQLVCPKPCSLDAEKIPTTLASALDILEISEVMKAALSPIMKIFLCVKRGVELTKFSELEENEEKTKQLEREMYFVYV